MAYPLQVQRRPGFISQCRRNRLPIFNCHGNLRIFFTSFAMGHCYCFPAAGPNQSRISRKRPFPDTRREQVPKSIEHVLNFRLDSSGLILRSFATSFGQDSHPISPSLLSSGPADFSKCCSYQWGEFLHISCRAYSIRSAGAKDGRSSTLCVGSAHGFLHFLDTSRRNQGHQSEVDS